MELNQTAKHPLRGLLSTQFFGAFNDNAWKMIVIGLAVTSLPAGSTEADEDSAELFENTLAFLALTVPLLIFSIPAGALCDRVSKRTVILWMKCFELILMVAATLSVFFVPGSEWLRLGILSLMGVQSALFSPAKYGVLPEIVPHERLSAANGLLELWTFIAIIAGTAAAGELLGLTNVLSEAGGDMTWMAPCVLAVLSVVGLICARGIPRVPAARESGGMFSCLGGAWRIIRGDRVLWLATLGSSFYWGVASLVGAAILVFGKLSLGLENPGLLLAVFGIGVGAGSVLAGKLSGGKVEYGLIPLGAVGLGFFLLVLGLVPPTQASSFALMVLLGVSSGFIVVPLNAILQWRATDGSRGAVIALANVLVFGGMIAGNLGGLAISETLSLSSSGTLICAALFTCAGTIWAIWLLPDAFLRLILVVVTHTFYRLTVRGRGHVPREGGALLVPNHVSFVDGLFLLATVDRPVRFVVDSAYFKHPFYGPFLRSLKAIEISSSGGPRVILKAMRRAGEFLDQGEVVCIFAEGQITRTGTLQPFRRGLERIVKGRTAPIVPVHLDRVWGSIFSRAGGRFLTKIPRRVPYPVTVSFGEPLPPGTTVCEIGRRVHELGTDSWRERRKDCQPLHRTFFRGARWHPFRLLFADPSRPKVSGFGAMVATIALARRLRADWVDQQNVGILLPPSVASASVNIAASLSGRTTVNLNYTVGRSGLESACRQASLKTLLTSRVFAEKAKFELPEGVKILWLEDIAAELGLLSKAAAAFLALCAPVRWMERSLNPGRSISIDDTVTIIFSSGSTSEPKGVCLTHFNIDSNIEGVAQVLLVRRSDTLLGILPHFHSFGYMSLWFSANLGVASVFLPNPLDAAAVGETVLRYNVTLMLATPTFLQIYLRRCTAAQFGSLRVVLAGAEKLSRRLTEAFEDQFGIRPLEGYGTTECAPVIAASTLDYRAPGFYQPGSRRGSVGQPLPGVSVRIVDPEDPGVEKGANEEGMVIVRGPNVMRGYLNKDELTNDVVRDGWYVTGDIGVMDDDRFLRITDRLSRFSKIGGEMVPHGKVEEALQSAAGVDVQVFAVTSVPDEKKGERLAVLHTLEEAAIDDIVATVGECGLPNLFVPRVDQFFRVEALPYLGTGKLDLREVKRLALERAEAQREKA